MCATAAAAVGVPFRCVGSVDYLLGVVYACAQDAHAMFNLILIWEGRRPAGGTHASYTTRARALVWVVRVLAGPRRRPGAKSKCVYFIVRSPVAGFVGANLHSAWLRSAPKRYLNCKLAPSDALVKLESKA